MNILLVVGSHKLDDTAYVLERLKERKFDFLITSASKGVNAVARAYARRTGKKYKIFSANWNAFKTVNGKNPAGVINAEEMIKFAANKMKTDCVKSIAIMQNDSAGTTNEIRLIREKRIPLRVYQYGRPTLDKIFKKYEKSL